MSIAVAIEDIPSAIAAQIGWCYLLTVSDDGQARVLAVAPTANDDGTLRFSAGRGTAANATARPSVTLVFPPADPHAMSLIIDGTATVTNAGTNAGTDAGTEVSVTPTWAVMHRSAVPPL